MMENQSGRGLAQVHGMPLAKLFARQKIETGRKEEGRGGALVAAD
jgi:hypothetical protein